MAKLYSKDFLKATLLFAVIIFSLGYGISSLFKEVKFNIDDNEADFASKWLEQSNDAPEACLKQVDNQKQWFDNFIKNRKSIGPLKQRYLKSKQYPVKGKKTSVEIIFETSFANARRKEMLADTDSDQDNYSQSTTPFNRERHGAFSWLFVDGHAASAMLFDTAKMSYFTYKMAAWE
jgi:hypothetical protein